MGPGGSACQAKPTTSTTFPALYPFPRSTTPKFSKIGRERGEKSIVWEVIQYDSCQINFQICKYGYRPLRTPGYVQEGLWSLEILAVVHSQGCCKRSEFAKRTNRASSIKVSSYVKHISSATILVGQMEAVKQISATADLKQLFISAEKFMAQFWKLY